MTLVDDSFIVVYWSNNYDRTVFNDDSAFCFRPIAGAMRLTAVQGPTWPLEAMLENVFNIRVYTWRFKLSKMPTVLLSHQGFDEPVIAICGGSPANGEAQNSVGLKKKSVQKSERDLSLVHCSSAVRFFELNHFWRLMIRWTACVDRSDWFVPCSPGTRVREYFWGCNNVTISSRFVQRHNCKGIRGRAIFSLFFFSNAYAWSLFIILLIRWVSIQSADDSRDALNSNIMQPDVDPRWLPRINWDLQSS